MVVWFHSLQAEKELSKLMSRAMKEGLEGLVLKDVNVMHYPDLYQGHNLLYGYMNVKINQKTDVT